MFSDITFYVKGKTIEVDGQDFLLGELTESCLNITPDEYHELKEKHKKLKDTCNLFDYVFHFHHFLFVIFKTVYTILLLNYTIVNLSCQLDYCYHIYIKVEFYDIT